jgi:hypothetical protein
MRFKCRYLQPVIATRENGGDGEDDGFQIDSTDCPVAYRYSDSFSVDLENGCAKFGFKCLIKGSEGAGTQFLYFEPTGNVRRLQHTLSTYL